MNQHMDSVEGILSKLKPRGTEQIPQNITNIKTHINNELLKTTVLIGVILVIVFAFIYIFTNNHQSFNTTLNHTITSENIENFYNMAHKIATCENKNYMKVHAEFRKKYNYQSYKHMPNDLYKQIYSEESHRICILE